VSRDFELGKTSVAKSRPSVPHGANLFKFCVNYIFVIGEAAHFKFRVMIDTAEYECRQKECVQSHVFFKFWEISDNISEAMQD